VTGGVYNADVRDAVFGNGGPGYSVWSNSKVALDQAVAFKEEWRLHDLRRTFRSGLGQLGVEPHIAEACLNHLPEKLIRTYDKNKYEPQKRQAFDRWSAHVVALVA